MASCPEQCAAAITVRMADTLRRRWKLGQLR